MWAISFKNVLDMRKYWEIRNRHPKRQVMGKQCQIISLNIKGLGDPIKRKIITNYHKSIKPCVFMLQEICTIKITRKFDHRILILVLIHLHMFLIK